MVLRKPDLHIQKNEAGRLSNNTHTNKLKVNETAKCKT